MIYLLGINGLCTCGLALLHYKQKVGVAFDSPLDGNYLVSNISSISSSSRNLARLSSVTNMLPLRSTPGPIRLARRWRAVNVLRASCSTSHLRQPGAWTGDVEFPEKMAAGTVTKGVTRSP